jgi:SSS family solute:Na+ symporter
MIFIKMAAEILMTLLLVATGFALLSFYLRRGDLLPADLSLTVKQDADKIFPYFIAHQLPPALAGGVLAALFSAAMSTISSGVNSMAAVFTVDFFRQGKKEQVSDAEQIRLGAWFTAASGLAITAIAAGLAVLPGEHNFIDLMQKAFNFLLGPLGGLFFIGMFFPRCRSVSAVVSTVSGLVLGLLMAYSEQFFGVVISPFWVIACPCALTLVCAAVLALVEPPAAEATGPLTWRGVVNGQPKVAQKSALAEEVS